MSCKKKKVSFEIGDLEEEKINLKRKKEAQLGFIVQTNLTQYLKHVTI